ncbi:MAG: hypothetical protein ACRDAW_01995, partial [Metamycoplasmataceae bacterium]
MNKKLLTSLGALSTIAIIAPTLVITSCAGETPATINLTITAIANPKLTNADITVLEGSNLQVQLTSLQKLFEGKDLIEANQNNFSISIDKDKNVVTLNPKPGYTIDGKNTLASNAYVLETTPTDIDLNIKAIQTAATLNTTEVTALTGTDKIAQLAALQKLFEGTDLKTENLTNFVVSVNTETKIVTLTANEGFTIGNQPKLDST